MEALTAVGDFMQHGPSDSCGEADYLIVSSKRSRLEP